METLKDVIDRYKLRDGDIICGLFYDVYDVGIVTTGATRVAYLKTNDIEKSTARRESGFDQKDVYAIRTDGGDRARSVMVGESVNVSHILVQPSEGGRYGWVDYTEITTLPASVEAILKDCDFEGRDDDVRKLIETVYEEFKKAA